MPSKNPFLENVESPNVRNTATGPQDKPSTETNKVFAVFPSPSLPPNVSIVPCESRHVSSLRRVIGTLLQVRYSDKFFGEITSDPTIASLTRVAVWHVASSAQAEGQVIGGIRARLEEKKEDGKKEIYIQTLCLLSPYRRLGIAAALLQSLIESAITRYSATSVYAHVWEENDEALEWYQNRGFTVDKQVVEGYYRKLKPDGAKVVRRRIGVGDYLRLANGSNDDRKMRS
ncbi:MAG: hypothetical protein M1834_009263 [Cirrosporium novae-zelandiae]|nr:MAG: hypothetical protein M1834_009263 [Cirrosporium novae-zelandiae]